MYLNYVVSNKDQVYIVIWNNTQEITRTSKRLQHHKPFAEQNMLSQWVSMTFLSFHLFVLQSLTLHKNKTLQEVLIKN